MDLVLSALLERSEASGEADLARLTAKESWKRDVKAEEQ